MSEGTFFDDLVEPTTSELLERVVTVLDAGLDDDAPPAIVRVRRIDDGDGIGDIEIAHRDTGGVNPVYDLIGLTAPDDWIALGVASNGNARSMDDGSFLCRMRSVVLQHRDGDAAATMRLGDGRVVDDVPVGRTMDCLRRAFGLPTPPPSCGTAQIHALAWLAAIDQAIRRGSVPWRRLVALHPAMEVTGRTDPTELPDASREAEDIMSWGSVRRLVADGRLDVHVLSPEEAAWMDDGAFARWLAVEHPVAGQLAHLEKRLPSSTSRRLRRTLAELGVLDAVAAAVP